MSNKEIENLPICLLAAAPAMLKALEVARKFLARTHEYQGGFMEAEDAMNAIDAAIRLAKGESQ